MEIIPDITYTSQLTLSILFWGMAFIQLFWLLFFYLRIASHKEKTIENKDLPVRKIIAARNEEDNLYEFLPDRKSTRLNSSHVRISYAVFCLKKKKTKSL